MAAPFQFAWGNTPCRGSGPAFDLVGGPLGATLSAASAVVRLPYIGPAMQANMAAQGIANVGQLIQHFQNNPALTTPQLHRRISRLLRNPRQNRCASTVNAGILRRYQVSDTNQCAYNSVVQLLQFVHQHWGLPHAVPNAQHLVLRVRGNNAEVRECACQPTAATCNALAGPGPGCRWTPAHHTHMGVGACTPRGGLGFVGYANNDRYDQHSGRAANRARVHVQGNPNNGGGHYVRQWRVPTPPPLPPRRRSRRRRTRSEMASVADRVRRRRRAQSRASRGVHLHACGTGGSPGGDKPTNILDSIVLPDETWGERTKRAWARAVVDRFKTPRPPSRSQSRKGTE